MRSYLVVSGALFALLVGAHVARMVVEGVGVAGHADFVVSTIVGVGMTAWALRLLVRK
jgi:hypothetical protein